MHQAVMKRKSSFTITVITSPMTLRPKGPLLLYYLNTLKCLTRAVLFIFNEFKYHRTEYLLHWEMIL